MVASALFNTAPGPFQMDLISDWIESLGQANQLTRKRTSTSSTSSTTSSAASSPPSSPSVSSFSSSMLKMPSTGLDSDYTPLPAFPAASASILSMPRMPARASLAKSRRAGDLVRDSMLDLAMDRRAKAASQTWWD